MPAAKPPPVIAATAVAVAAITAVLLSACGGSGRVAAGRSCAAYPTPGTVAPPGTQVPLTLAAKYSVFRAGQRPIDRLSPGQVAALNASGVISSGTRFVGDAAFGGRIYLVPAEHLLSFPIAPARCLRPVQRRIEASSLPVLRSEYRTAALCVAVVGGNGPTQECAPARGTPYPLLSARGTPGFGLVPNGVSAVTVSYWAAPPRTVAVRRNFFAITAPSQAAPPCGVQWLDATGNVTRTPSGCSYLGAETHELNRYRQFVLGKLSTLRTQVATLSAAIASGDMTTARSAWLAAHLTWLQIGQDDGAYGAFGALGGKIDGLAAGHALGTADPGFTGFHRIEFELWTKRDLAAAAAQTSTLSGLLAQLVKVPLWTYLPGTAAGVGNWLLRPHEVLEDAVRDTLTAEDDYGSGSDLATIAADADAVRTLLSDLAPSLTRLAPHLAGTARRELTALIDATRAGGSIQALTTRQRQQLDADAGAAVETLAPIPDLLTSTGSNAPAG